MVVSEMGEQWSPHTAPDRQAAMEMTSISPSGNAWHTMGIRMEKVPQLVPVAKARNTATRKMITGLAQAVLGSRASLFTSLVLLAVAIVVELVVLSIIRARTIKKAKA